MAASIGTPVFYFTQFAITAANRSSTDSVYIELHKGENPTELTHFLSQRQIISNGKSFLWLGKILRQWKKIKAGEYKVSASMSPLEIFSTLTSGISAAHPVTVREGENMYEIAEDLMSKGLADPSDFLFLCKDRSFITSLKLFTSNQPSTLEGYLFPDTYFFNRTMTTAEMIQQMTRHFFSFWDQKLSERAGEIDMDRSQVVILASMIEKETGAAEERTLISSVFHNRLKKKMKLQSDPTTIYGMWDHFHGKIHKKDLSEKNAYNTYVIPALPIGPISNPGKEAIRAALYPAENTFLYFVSHNDGTTQFSHSLEEHSAAVRKFQMDPKARVGKSWRDHLRRPSGNLSSH